jgi:hypothetical protein
VGVADLEGLAHVRPDLTDGMAAAMVCWNCDRSLGTAFEPSPDFPTYRWVARTPGGFELGPDGVWELSGHPDSEGIFRQIALPLTARCQCGVTNSFEVNTLKREWLACCPGKKLP